MLPLLTDRLQLRRRTVQDAAIVHALWRERDPRVPPARRLDARGAPTVADLADSIRRERADPRPGLLSVQRHGEGDVIGYCGLVFDDAGRGDEPELAFELLRRVHGRGYATEAGAAVLTWATGLGYPRVWATVRDWNTASRRVLAKLGFHETGQAEVDAVHGTNLLVVRAPDGPGRMVAESN